MELDEYVYTHSPLNGNELHRDIDILDKEHLNKLGVVARNYKLFMGYSYKHDQCREHLCKFAGQPDYYIVDACLAGDTGVDRLQSNKHGLVQLCKHDERDP